VFFEFRDVELTWTIGGLYMDRSSIHVGHWAIVALEGARHTARV